MTMNQNTTVRFDDASTQTFLICDDLSNTAPLDVLWYTAKDYEQFRQDAPVRTVQNTSCRQFVESLLMQQRCHRENGIVDPKGLYVLSKACSKRAKERALKLGLLNAEDLVESAKGSPAKFLHDTPSLTELAPSANTILLPNTILAISA
jgi:hypothetical protein